ncbi:acyltransferase-domain-containing protein [Vararia minispora EC-137]|uniref:Acyltransferase-domain-containing protein n=1 Tax=Vararia minispora EC-137 TaxID=1314806 RepID=A0ACB8Q7S6_9AGAM|nr:acyltransferase-domain-containing protein [Vararia minispora EC-137]
MRQSGPGPTPATWSYLLIRLLFKFVLKVFYGTIVVEGLEHIPPLGEACIVCANHANSLTDALLLVKAIPYKRRGMLRLTAKSTQFGRGTFTSWLIESAGTLPIKRRKDFGDADVDNSAIMNLLIEALGRGDAICLFPEGASRYHPKIAPLKTGVVRLVSDTLTAHGNEPDFRVSTLTCSITYMHRQHFRTDVLVTFHPLMTYTPRTHPELLAPANRDVVRRETEVLYSRIASGTLDAPSWELVRCAWLAASIYAPLGTRMRLGDYVRVARAFLEAFKAADTDDAASRPDEEVGELVKELKVYVRELSRLRIKDDRIRQPLSRPTIFSRMLLRASWAGTLLALSFPGLLLWTPVALTTFIGVHEFTRTGGPVWDTWDEIAQYKLVYGLISGAAVWAAAVLLTLPVALITAVLIPAIMWMSLRWFEDAVAAARAFVALARLVLVPCATLTRLRAQRTVLHARLVRLAAERLGLPADPESAYAKASGPGHKGRVAGPLSGKARYFSVTRRRKKDWAETLRLYEDFDYPEDETC